MRPLWHLSPWSSHLGPCCAQSLASSPAKGHKAREPRHGSIWCETGLMKVQHGAKWVCTSAGWGANDGTAPWAAQRRDLCQGIWQLALCLAKRFRLDLSPECSLPGLPPLPVFGFSSPFPPHSDGLSVGLLDDKYLVLYLKMWAPGQGKGIENIAACS